MIERENAGISADLGRGPGAYSNTMKRKILPSSHRSQRRIPVAGSFVVSAGLLGAAQAAKAQPGYAPIEVLAVEELQDGALRVSTPEGWAVLASDQWALAGGQILVREGTVIHATRILPWEKVGYAIGGVGVAGGATLGGYHLIMRESEPDDTTTSTSSTATATATGDAAIADVGDEGTAPVILEGANEVQNHSSYFTGDTLIDSLLSEYEEHWAGAGSYNQPATVTYSFADNGSALSEEQGVEPQAIPAFFRQAVRDQLDGLEAVANLEFVEVTDTGVFDEETGEGRGQINIVLAADNINTSFAVLPQGEEPWLDDRGGDVVFTGGMLDEGLWVDEYRGGAMTITHEILHALGLEHPFEGYLDAPDYIDNHFYTLLSYTSVHTDTYFPDVPMIADIAALQHLYGVNTETNAGNDVYVFDSQEVYLGTIWDAGGVDTIQHTGSRDAIINLQAGSSSQVGASPTNSNVYSVESIGFDASATIDRIVVDDPTDGWAEITEDGKSFRLVHDPDTSDLDGDGLMDFTVFLDNGDSESYRIDNHDVDVGLRDNLHIAQSVTIENAEGGDGDDRLMGNAADNMLTGGGGDDVLTGGAGADVFVFRSGFDDDVITDFTIGEDRLYFSAIDEGTAEFTGGDTVVTVAGEGTITLQDIDVTGLYGTETLIA